MTPRAGCFLSSNAELLSFPNGVLEHVMKIGCIRTACFAVAAAFVVGGCASTQPPKESGFLKDYSNLTKQDAPGGGSRLVYKSPAFTPGKYTAVMLDPMVYYPEPQPTEQVSSKAL